ncbi:MAG: hypothetical protein QM652_07330 [Legionella sp.]|uniref:hypothetical protein n=1 Tax=Legionella sp. TaxID=459 RepID=UPI0039E3EA55
MKIPKQALRESDLEIDSKVSVSEGTHSVEKVQFTMNGRSQEGFFKKLNTDNFPALLIKMSVGASVYLDSFQGNEKTAAEYLVFSDTKSDEEVPKIIGLVSSALKGFTRLKFRGEPLAAGEDKEKVIPSRETLIKEDYVRTLFYRLHLGDDDTHAGNFGPKGGFDYDMFWYWFTVHMKGGRIVVDPPKMRVDFDVTDYEQFPDIKIAAPYHWPAFDHPGQNSTSKVKLPENLKKTALAWMLPKVNADPKEFVALANDSRAHAQKVAAALQILVTYQPKVLRKRLEERFGDLKFDYTSLERDNPDQAAGRTMRMQYETSFPKLCNSTTDQQSFVDVIMNMYHQIHYDELYRVVVFYMGCKDHGFKLPTYLELYNKPSIYQNILAWVEKENASPTHTSPDNLLDLQEIKTQYHSIWCGSFAPWINQLILKSRNLAEKLKAIATNNSESTTNVSVKQAEAAIQNPTETALTEAWQLFTPLNNLSLSSSTIRVDKDSNVHQAAVLAIQFTNELQDITKAYYTKKPEELTEEDNDTFIYGLRRLHQTYERTLPNALNHTTSYAEQFFDIRHELRELDKLINFHDHLESNDQRMQHMNSLVTRKELLPLNHPNVLAEFNGALFDWVDKLSPLLFNQQISEIIDEKYSSRFDIFSTRKRAVPVKEYLMKSPEPNSDKLAYILSSAKSGDEGALNASLIDVLSSKMLKEMEVTSASDALRAGTFTRHLTDFVKASVLFASTDQRFTHLRTLAGVELVCSTMYEWVSKHEPSDLFKIITIALNNYERSLSTTKSFLYGTLLGGNTSRKPEIQKTFTLHSNNPAQALALTFMGGDKESTASLYIFKGIIHAMKEQINANKELLAYPGYYFVNLFDEDNDSKFYLDKIKNRVTESRTKTDPHYANSSTLIV